MEATVTTPIPSLDEWRQIVSRLEEQVKGWCGHHGWTVTQTETHVVDARPQFGYYVIPSLSMETHTSDNRLIVEPMPHAFDGTGMIRLYAWPTLYRVRLLYRGSPTDWEILTDSRIPLHEEWNEPTFIRLAQDLLKADY